MSEAPQMVRPSPNEKEIQGSLPLNRPNPLGSTEINIEQFFPSSTFRAGQREAIHQIYDAFFRRNKRIVVAELPTGVGKSYVAATFAKLFKSAHILTVQKILQSQYESTFSWMFSMKGRAAYSCLRAPTKTCAQGPCRLDKNLKDTFCPHKVAWITAHEKPFVIHNFDSFYYQNKAMPYQTRPLLVIDEAHQLENKYLSFMSFTISNQKNPLLVVPNLSNAKEYKTLIGSQLLETTQKIDFLENKNEMSLEESIMFDSLKELQTKLEIFLYKIDTTEYVVDFEDHKTYQAAIFRPLFVGDYIADTLLTKGECVLMLSATFLDKHFFCSSSGLKESEVEFIQIDSSFPVENRPIYRKYAGSMSYGKIEDTLPKSLEILKQILSKFPNKRGIIQTHSERIANYIKTYMSDESRLTFRKDYTTVEGMLEAHKIKENSFIVASGLREGIDLYDDLSRVQILMKVPYPDLGDKRTKRRKELDPSWYGVQTTLAFVQTLGRSIRSETDKAVTFILDESFEIFYRMNKRYIPRYIREAIK
jgi:Rad3-related DNA helicase